MTKTYIGTFGVGNETKSKVYQPIEAVSFDEAMRVMVRGHGREWAMLYTLNEYKEAQDEGFFDGHQPLRYIGGTEL